MKTEELTSDRIMELLCKHAGEMRSRFSVQRIGLFGSYSRRESRVKSDIDILVKLSEPTFDNYMDLKFFLEELLNREVDLVMAETLKRRLRPGILRDVIYAEGL